jgi:NitT/TauT family transport system substrate-binding protein
MKRIYLLLLIIIFLASSCSGGKTDKIRLAYLQGDLHQLACWAALEKNYFKDEGLDVEVAGIFKAGPEELSAFSAGSLDIGYVGQAPATTAAANKTADIVVLAQVNYEGSAIVVRKDSKITKFSDLSGKTVAIPGHSTVQEFLLKRSIIKFGLENNKIGLIVLKPPEMINALASKQIDAFIAWEPYPAKAVTSGTGKILITSSDMWKGHQCCVLIADKKFYENNPDKIKGIIRAHIKATDFIGKNIDYSVEIAVKYSGMDEATVRTALNNIKYGYIPAIEGEIEYVEFLNKLGYIKIENPRAFTEGFIDSKIVNELLKK